MLRYLWPLLFFAATGYAWQHNANNSSSKIVVPFVDVLYPPAAGNPQMLGEISVYVALGISVLVLLSTMLEHFRTSRRQAAAAAAEEDEA